MHVDIHLTYRSYRLDFGYQHAIIAFLRIMMFSQTVEYALRAVVCLAQNPDKSLTAQEIARLTRVPANYLSKVLQLLAKEEVIIAMRGVGGGYRLGKPATELSILRVINAIDPLKRIKHCPLGLQSHGTNLCPLHYRMDRVLLDAEEAFAKTMIAELLTDPTRSTPLCEMPVVGSVR